MQRQTHNKPLLDAFCPWAVAQRLRLSGKTPLGKALQYELGRWDALTPYIEGSRLSIASSLAEIAERNSSYSPLVPIVAVNGTVIVPADRYSQTKFMSSRTDSPLRRRPQGSYGTSQHRPDRRADQIREHRDQLSERQGAGH